METNWTILLMAYVIISSVAPRAGSHASGPSRNRRTCFCKAAIKSATGRSVSYSSRPSSPKRRVNALMRVQCSAFKSAEDCNPKRARHGSGAVHDKVESENITKVLYPNDEPVQGRELRLKQQYFFVSCSLQDMIRLYLQREKTLDRFHEKFAVQLNDTHPSLAIPELMRLLVDDYCMDWETAWDITQRTFSYTNHTL